MRMTNRELNLHFHELNRRYFARKLDSNIRVQFGKIKQLGVTKHVWFQRPATARERRENKLNKTAITCYNIPRIWISEDLRFFPSIAVTTLLHEMVHAENMKRSNCRGPNWKWFHRRMLKLAKDGAFNGWW